MQLEYLSSSPEETAEIAVKIADLVTGEQRPVTVFLEGDLGAGKTLFASAFINFMLPQPQVITSPTYLIEQVYDSANGMKISHYDLYRVKHSSELDEIGFFDSLSENICLIEWPGLLEELQIKPCIEIAISHTSDCESKRRLLISGKLASSLVK